MTSPSKTWLDRATVGCTRNVRQFPCLCCGRDGVEHAPGGSSVAGALQWTNYYRCVHCGGSFWVRWRSADDVPVAAGKGAWQR